MKIIHPEPAILTAAVALLRPYAPDISPEKLQSALEQYAEPAPAKAGLRESDRPLTRRQAADYLGVSLATINRYVKAGKLKRIPFTRRAVRITPASIRALIAEPVEAANEIC